MILKLSLPKLPLPNFEVPKPARWDWITMGTVALGLALVAYNLHLSQTDPQTTRALTPAFTFAQLAICIGSLMLLGKTAKEGTIWGNLAAVAGMFLGMGGVLLAAAMWASA